jgi:hypothetical protein
MKGERNKPVPTGINADDEEFKTDVSSDVHDEDEEMVELLDSKGSNTKRRG